ncbi:MAG: hypothetical protein H7838_06255 [Magnetococcus sp. DMHC-8]
MGWVVLCWLGWLLSWPLQAADHDPQPLAGRARSPRVEPAPDKAAVGDITVRGRGYRGDFGWSIAGDREIDPGDDHVGSDCQPAVETASARLWDGNGQCFSVGGRGGQPAAVGGASAEEGEP